MGHKNGKTKYKITNPESYTSSPAAASPSPSPCLLLLPWSPSSHFLPPFSRLAISTHKLWGKKKLYQWPTKMSCTSSVVSLYKATPCNYFTGTILRRQIISIFGLLQIFVEILREKSEILARKAILCLCKVFLSGSFRDWDIAKILPRSRESVNPSLPWFRLHQFPIWNMLLFYLRTPEY